MSPEHDECRRVADELSRAIGDQQDIIVRLASKPTPLTPEERRVLTSARDLRDEFNDRLKGCVEEHEGRHYDFRALTAILGQMTVGSIARVGFGLSGRRPPKNET